MLLDCLRKWCWKKVEEKKEDICDQKIVTREISPMICKVDLQFCVFLATLVSFYCIGVRSSPRNWQFIGIRVYRHFAPYPPVCVVAKSQYAYILADYTYSSTTSMASKIVHLFSLSLSKELKESNNRIASNNGNVSYGLQRRTMSKT